jgi:hypothetical protein
LADLEAIGDSVLRTAAITTAASDRKSVTADSLGAGSVSAGDVVKFSSGEARVVAAFDPGAHRLSWATALVAAPSGEARIYAAKAFRIRVWDSAEELTRGVDTLNIVKDVSCVVLLNDVVPPVAAVKPFFWNGAADNSLYGGSRDNGHVELTGISAYGPDPDVSGRVSFRGSAFDDQRIEMVYLYLDGTGGFEFPAAEADATFDDGGSKTFKRVAHYDAAQTTTNSFTASGDIDTDHWHFEVTSSSFSQEGHRIEWRLDWDSAYVDNVVALDRTLRVVVEDKAGNDNLYATGTPPAYAGTAARPALTALKADALIGSPYGLVGLAVTLGSATTRISAYDSAAGTLTLAEPVALGQTAYSISLNARSYGFDVVPYVREITTALGVSTPTNPSVMNRSALGRYGAWKNAGGAEKIRLAGFNLAPSYVVVGKDADGVNDGLDALAASVDSLDFSAVTARTLIEVDLAKALRSGFINVVASFGGTLVSSINNLNENTVSYNAEPNGVNNDSLTDDRWIDVWESAKLDFGELRMVDMSMNGDAVNFGFGYGDQKAAVSLAGAAPITTRSSYTRYFDNKLAFNEAGQYFLVAQCGDTLNAPVGSWADPSHFGLTFNRATSVGNLQEYGNGTGTGNLWIESNWNGSGINKLDRVQWPDIKVKGDAANSVVYLSYYDSMQKLLKARIFKVGTGVATGSGITAVGTLATGVQTTLIPYQGGAAAWGSVQSAAVRYTDTATSNAYTQGFTAIAGANANSPYSAIAFTPDGTALVAWYDAANGDLKLKYNTDPTASFSGYQAFASGAAPAAGTYGFKLFVDGASKNGGNAIHVTVSSANLFELAYQLNKVLSEQYGAFAEVDPVTQLLTVRSFNTGSASGVSISETDPSPVTLGSASLASAKAKADGACTADRTTDLFTLNGHPFMAGDPVVFTAGTMPGNLTANQVYYVINNLANTFQVSATPGGAFVNMNVTNGATLVVHSVITASAAHGLSVGDAVSFTATSLPSGLAANTAYWVRTVPSPNAFTVATTAGGNTATLGGGAVGLETVVQYFETASSHGLAANEAIRFTATGLPGGIAAGTSYYVRASGLAAARFNVSATSGGTQLFATSPGSGVTYSRIATSLVLAMGGVNAAFPGRGAAWVERTIDDDYAGKYVAMVVDNDSGQSDKGGIHLAYQKSSAGDLRYAFLPTYDCVAGSVKKATVDAYLQVGQYIDISVKYEDVNGDTDFEYIPYISYYNISNADTLFAVKTARLNVEPASVGDGVGANERFTGRWEVATVPAREVAKQYRVSNGIRADGGYVVGYQGDLIEYARYVP